MTPSPLSLNFFHKEKIVPLFRAAISCVMCSPVHTQGSDIAHSQAFYSVWVCRGWTAPLLSAHSPEAERQQDQSYAVFFPLVFHMSTILALWKWSENSTESFKFPFWGKKSPTALSKFIRFCALKWWTSEQQDQDLEYSFSASDSRKWRKLSNYDIPIWPFWY